MCGVSIHVSIVPIVIRLAVSYITLIVHLPHLSPGFMLPPSWMMRMEKYTRGWDVESRHTLSKDVHANTELQQILKVPKSRVAVVKGHKSRDKVVAVDEVERGWVEDVVWGIFLPE